MAVSTDDPRYMNSAPISTQIIPHQPRFLYFKLLEPYTVTLNFWVDKIEDSFLRVVVARQED